MAATEVNAIVDAVFERPPEQGISLAMVVLHHGEVIAERYGHQPATIFGPAVDIDATTPLLSWSTAKSMTHAAAAILVDDGRLDLDAPASVPSWAGTEKAAITVLDLLEMRPGLRFAEDYVDGEVSDVIAMLFGDGAADHAAFAAAMPLDHPPGTVWNYSSGTTNIVARLLGDIVGGGEDGMRAFLRERLFEPAGMRSADPDFDGAGTWVGSSYVHATARDFARFGELYRRDGVNDAGERVLAPGWLEHARTTIAHDPTDDLEVGFGYGRHWWTWPQFPGSVAAHGYEGQFIVVDPARRLTVVHLGKTDVTVRRHLVGHLEGLIQAVPPAS